MQDVIYTLPEYQDVFINSNERVVSIIGAKGSSKAQPLFEPVLTPTGFVYMHQLNVGDYVVGSNGKPTKVTGIYPQGVKQVYKVLMNDGTFTRATGDHLWAVQTGSQRHRGNGYKVMTTDQIRGDLLTKQGYCKWYLPLVKPIEFNSSAKLPLKPYALGALIGDGGMTKRQVVFSTKDTDILERVCEEVQISYRKLNSCDYYLSNKQRNKRGHSTNHLVQILDELELIGCKSEHKFIPKKYLYATVNDRIELLRGLMDTDGHTNSRGTGQFTTTSPQLANDVVFLCRSLGLTTRAIQYSQSNPNYHDYYSIRINAPFNPFWLSRKADSFNVNATQGRCKGIIGIEEDGEEMCQCISVQANDSLYVTRDFVLTHNTWSGARFVLVQITKQPNKQGLVMFNTLQQARDIFYQDIEPVLKELAWPFKFNEQKMVLKCLGSIVHFRSAEPDAVKKIESVAYHWGWADEASYYDPTALKTFVSRIRKGMALVRITSMPDEPDAFIYGFVERLNAKLYEISLKDNPDKEFAERYEEFLRATYTGPELERYLSGKRVSLSGMGLFAMDASQRGRYMYLNTDDIYLVWDFNVEFRAVSAWQLIGKDEKARPIVACVDSWKLVGATVQEDAIELCQQLKNHKGRVFLHGDASGENRSASTTSSMWKMVKTEFEKVFENIRYIVPTKNPPVKDTIQCLNWALREGLVKFDEQESNVYSSLSAIKADKYGEIDKSMDYKANSTARSHHGDTARYLAFEIYKHIYPGGTGGWWVV